MRRITHIGYDSSMEPDEDPFADLLALQESRRERRARLVRRRRWAVIGTLIGLMVLAGIGVGVYELLTREGSSPDSSTTSGSETATTATSGGVAQSTTTSSLMANLAPQKLAITTHPETASAKITLQDGTTLSGKTPFSQQVPGGNIQIELTKKGYNTAARRLSLTQPSGLDVWLDPAGQLVESVVRFESGPGPQQLAFSPDGRELWVALMGGGLEIYSPTTGAKTGEVALGGDSTADVVFSEDGNTIYAVDMKSGLVYEVDRVSRTVKRQLQTEGTSPKVLLLSNDGKTLWTANWAATTFPRSTL